MKTLIPSQPLAAFVLAVQLLWAGPACAAAPSELRVAPATYPAAPLKVSLTREDWTYRVGEPAAFLVKIDRKPYPAEGIRISYRLGPDMLEGRKPARSCRKRVCSCR